MKRKLGVGYLGVVALMAFGFEMCLIDEVWIRILAGVIDILAFLFDLGEAPKDKKGEMVDGKLVLFNGEDDYHIAIGLTMDVDPTVLMTKKTTTLEVVNNIKGENGDGQ